VADNSNDSGNQLVVDNAALAQSFANSEAGICIFDAQRRYLWVNDRFLALTGYTRDKIDSYRAGENLRLQPLNQDEFISMVTSALSAGEADIARANGKPLAVEYVVIPTTIGNEPCFIGMMWPLDGHALPENWSTVHH